MSKFRLVNKAHNIYFENENAERAYAALLEFRCKVCKKDFSSWKELDTHLRREHELFVCELCTGKCAAISKRCAIMTEFLSIHKFFADNLKVFSYERKYYTRKDLARHRKTGDPDDTRYAAAASLK